MGVERKARQSRAVDYGEHVQSDGGSFNLVGTEVPLHSAHASVQARVVFTQVVEGRVRQSLVTSIATDGRDVLIE